MALAILPWVIANGVAWPWQPSTIDLQVYVYAVQDMLAGKDIYATTTPFWNLYFIYPPIAAVLMVPLAVGPYWLWQLIRTFLLIWAQRSVMKRCGVPRGWVLGLVGVVVVLAIGTDPHHPGLRPGQHHPDGTGGGGPAARPARRARSWSSTRGPGGRLPQGTFIGLAAAIKLTPALFAVLAFLAGRKRVAWTAVISFFAFTAFGAIFQWSQTWQFWFGLSGGNTRTASPLYVGNQSRV